MKVRIWDEVYGDEILVRLLDEGDEICLCVVDRDGDPTDGGFMLSINKKEGTVNTCAGFDDNLGFETDSEDHVIVGKDG